MMRPPVNIRFRSRLVPLLLPGLLLAAGTAAAGTVSAPHPYRIAVIDVFAEPSGEGTSQRELIAAGATDIDGDGLRENIYHGDLVSLFVGSEGIEIVPFPVSDGSETKRQILARLQQIRARRHRGEHLDAVVFCWESSTPISAIADTLDPAERSHYREIISAWGREDEGWRLTAEIIAALEDLAREGLLVVTIAGNSGPAWVNTYTFAEGVVVVGAAEQDPDGEWATCNPLVDTWAQSRYEIRLVGDPERPVFGYDINEDGLVDIDLRRGSSWFKRFGSPRGTHRVLRGTSFAAPTALRGMLARIERGDAD